MVKLDPSQVNYYNVFFFFFDKEPPVRKREPAGSIEENQTRFEVFYFLFLCSIIQRPISSNRVPILFPYFATQY